MRVNLTRINQLSHSPTTPSERFRALKVYNLA
jgi:hypothetical protein